MSHSRQYEAEQMDARAVASVRAHLADALSAHREALSGIAPEAADLVPVLSAFLEGGKLLRPRLTIWGGIAASTTDVSEEDLGHLAGLGAAIELVQAAALLHDDVIDHSPTRRGRPAVHVAAAQQHAAASGKGSSDDFGIAVAIVLGDLALSWSEQLFAAHLPTQSAHSAAARTEFDALRTEVMTGQYLDILHQAGGFSSPPTPADAALAVIRWKTVPYSTQRPLRLGAAAMGASPDLLEGLSAWAYEVGTAFQLRDDLLSIAGDPHATGKPTGGDIIEGKRTLVLELTRERADDNQRRALDAAVGNPHADRAQVEAAHQAMVDTGAVADVAERIRAHARAADELLGNMPTVHALAREQLARIGTSATSLHGLDLR